MLIVAGDRAKKSSKLKLPWDCLVAGWNMVRMPGRSHQGPLPQADSALLRTTGELRRHTTRLASEIGERNVRYRPAELQLTADYIEAEFTAAGYAVTRLGYGVDGTTCFNLEVEIAGSTHPDEIVIVGAHYDSVPGCPAANDNASGVAGVLSLAREMSASSNGRTVRFVAFVNEELPYAHTPDMGSWVYARLCRSRGDNVVAMLTLETIGCYSDAPDSQRYPAFLGRLYPSTGNFIAFVGNTRYARLVRQVVGAFRRSEPFPSLGGALPEAMSDVGRSDHWPFWQEGFPALMVTDTAPFRYAHYHTADDTVDKIDFERMARVIRGLHGVMADLAEGDIARA